MLGDRYGAYTSIGQGNNSRTFLGIDTKQLFDPRCLIKGFRHDPEMAETEMEVFRREAAVLDELGQHPQLPKLYAYFERGTQQYLVQEFVNGRNLLQQLQEEGTFNEVQMIELLQEILPVLHFLHNRNILHRDIKPANLIRRHDDGKLALVDLGSAKYLTRSAIGKVGTVLGSAEYTAPEQLAGRAMFASDLYSLGATCAHLLTGLSPFDLFDGTLRTWFWRSVSDPVSDRFAQVLDKLLSSDVQNRYQSIPDVVRDLQLQVSLPTTKGFLEEKPTHDPNRTLWLQVQTLEVGYPINAIAFSDDDRLVCGGNEPAIQVWDIHQKRLLQTLEGHQRAIATVVAVPNQPWAVSGSWDGTIRLWHLDTGKTLQEFTGHRNVVTCLAVNSDGQQLISGSRDRTIRVWNLATAELQTELAGHQGSIEAIAIDAGNRTLVSGSSDGSVKVWHLETKELLRTLSGHRAAVRAIALSPDGQQLMSGSWDMTTQIRRVTTGGILQKLSGHLLPVSALSLSPDEQLLATGSHDCSVKLWDFSNGKLFHTLSGHTGAIETVAFSGDGKFLASAGQDGTVRLWSWSQGRI